MPQDGSAHGLALGVCWVPARRRAAWLFGRRQAQSSFVRPPYRRERTDGSTPSRAAPAGERGLLTEVHTDVRDGADLPYGRADEQPLVGAAPVEEEPATIGRPDDVPEGPCSTEDRAGRATKDTCELQRAASAASLDEGNALSVWRDRGSHHPSGPPVETTYSRAALPEDFHCVPLDGDQSLSVACPLELLWCAAGLHGRTSVPLVDVGD